MSNDFKVDNLYTDTEILNRCSRKGQLGPGKKKEKIWFDLVK